MTSASIGPDSGTRGRHADGRGYGLVLFASVPLLARWFAVAVLALNAIGSRQNLEAV